MLKRWTLSFLTKSRFTGLLLPASSDRYFGQIGCQALLRSKDGFFSKYRELGLCLLPLWLDRSCRKLRGHHPAGGENPKRVALPILDVKQVQDTHVSHVEEVSIGGCLSPMWHPQAKGGPEQQHRYSRTAQGHGHAIGKIETRAAREEPE